MFVSHLYVFFGEMSIGAASHFECHFLYNLPFTGIFLPSVVCKRDDAPLSSCKPGDDSGEGKGSRSTCVAPGKCLRKQLLCSHRASLSITQVKCISLFSEDQLS